MLRNMTEQNRGKHVGKSGDGLDNLSMVCSGDGKASVDRINTDECIDLKDDVVYGFEITPPE